MNDTREWDESQTVWGGADAKPQRPSAPDKNATQDVQFELFFGQHMASTVRLWELSRDAWQANLRESPWAPSHPRKPSALDTNPKPD
ncbi:MAG: hypothetical protein ABIR33_12095 [Pyrinomonadaceae bacterium]